MEPAGVVRVEVDGAFDGQIDAPASLDSKPPRGPGRGWLVGVVAVTAVAVVLLLTALRPEDGETAAGTERQATTTTIAPTTTLAPTTTVPTELAVSQTAAARLSIHDVVFDGIGLVGMSYSDDDGDLQPYRSLLGADWDLIETELSPAATPTEGHWTWYRQLIDFDGGLAVLRVQEDDRTPTGRMTIDRLISSDRVVWDVDPEFEPIEVVSPDSWGLFHTDGAFGIVQNTGNARLEALVSGLLADDSDVDPGNVCWVDSQGSDRVRMSPCSSRGDETLSTEITTDDFVEPELFDQFVDCANAVQYGATDFTLDVQRSGGVAHEVATQHFAFGHTNVADGSIVSLGLDDTYFTESASCDAFVDWFPEPSEPAVQILSPDGELHYIPLPQQFPRDQLLNVWRTSGLFSSGNQVFVVLGTAAWSLNVDTEEWTQILDFPEPETDLVVYHFTSANRLVGVVDGQAVIGDVSQGTIATFEVSEDLGDWGWLIYANDDFLMLQTEGREVVRIELPA